MIVKIVKRSIALLFFAACLTQSHAQYYSWGADVPSLKWSDIKQKDKGLRIIYPDTVDGIARRTLKYLNAVQGYSDFGYKYPALKIPFVMHPENFQSNALVMWMPKRVDFLTTPDIDSYSMLWNKQLVAHEYRHAVQYNNLNKGFIKAASYILGEQGSSLGLLFLPLDIVEGDAVKCETSMSTFGRGLQPSFSMGYRAIGRDMLDRRNVDRWFCGSYNYYVPDHYKLGYQIVDYSYTRYKENIWNKVIEFAVKHPYYIVTTSTALKRYYGIDNAKLLRATFNDLFDYWDSLPERENSTEYVTAIDTDNYTTYSHPITRESGSVISLKSDYDYPSRFVEVDPESGTEQRVAYTGSVSTRPTLGGEHLWWSEFRGSKLFLQKVNSQLCYMNIEESKPRTIKGFGNTLYPTSLDTLGKRVAYVEYDPKGLYSFVTIEAQEEKIRNSKDFIEVSRTPITQYTQVHGLAWDDVTESLYFIGLDDSGMWLGVVDPSNNQGFRKLREGAYITLSDLRADGGVLYFGSIESGYDELHSYELKSGVERRISQSQYGSFDPSTPSRDGYSYATTYDKYGYHLSRQKLGKIDEVVTPSNTPQNIVNPERLQWDLINLDTVRYTALDSLASLTEHKSHKYNKGLKLLKVHSWIPVAMNPYGIVNEKQIDISLGATVMSQNLLSNTEAYASYGYNQIEGSLISGGIKYTGLGVNLEFEGKYGGNQIVYTPIDNTTYNQQEYYSLTTAATLPLIYQRGYHNRLLSSWVSWNYTNGVIFDLDDWVEYNKDTNSITNYGTIGLTTGLHKITFGVGYSDIARSAHRDLSTPFGYSISANYALCPNNENFSDLLSLYGKLYTRGLFPHNSFSVESCYQTSIGGYLYNGINLLSFSSVSLLPRGFSSTDIRNSNYLAASMNYKFPLLYPEGGIGSIIYLKRLSMKLGVDGAQFENYKKETQHIYSYGGSLILDINPLRMPEASTTAIELSLFQPSVGPLSFTMGVSLPF